MAAGADPPLPRALAGGDGVAVGGALAGAGGAGMAGRGAAGPGPDR